MFDGSQGDLCAYAGSTTVEMTGSTPRSFSILAISSR
jgi:hypothetical protein